MRFTIVTPSYGQLDWLELCIASVADQQGVGFIEHIVQDAGTAGIEEFARRMGADFYRDGGKVGRWEGEKVGKCDGESARADGAKVGKFESAKVEGEGKVNEWEGEKVGMWEGEGKVEECEGMKVGAERSEPEIGRCGDQTDWSEATAAERARRRARSTCEGGNVERKGYSLTIYSEKDAGMYDAINKGLRRATGETCAYLNCDEQYLPGTLRWVADYFSHSTETEVLFGAVIITRADGSYVCDRRVMVPTRWHTMVSGNLSIFTSSTFFRRKSVVERGLLFDPQWRVCGDAVWTLRFLEAGLRMEATHKPLSAFAETGVNMSALGNSRAAEENRRLALSAPAAARALKTAVLLAHRLRRWWSGAYMLRSHDYEVYTSTDACNRTCFCVNNPTFRWQMGVDAESA